MRHLLRNRRLWLMTAALTFALIALDANPARGQIKCTCRYAGMSYDQNTCVCMATSSGVRMACCEKVLNNTSWSFKEDDCPIAAAPDQSPMQSFAPGHQRSTDRALRLSAMAVK